MSNEAKSQMRAALKAELLPELRRRGFSGALPHFRRMTDSTISLLTVQFNKYGSSFAVEIGRAPASDYAPFPGKLVPATNLRVRHKITVSCSIFSRQDLQGR